MSDKKLPTSTDAVHAGEAQNRPFDSIPCPIVQTATYTFESTAELISLNQGTHPRERDEYGRYGNPTCRSVEHRLAALEGTEEALLFASGMAAVTTTILALVKAGQHVVFFKDGYRMTREFVTSVLPRFGVEYTLLDAGDLDGLASAIQPKTRLVVSESPTNPYLSCVDLERLAAICKEHRTVKSIIDATFATPINCRPASYGIDLVIHSATKYLAGHNDVLAGVVCGPRGLVDMVAEMRDVLGGVCDPHAAFLVGRGMKTLGLRVVRQNASAQAIAEHLEKHPAIKRVFYPGLPSHPDHAIASRQMAGFGGVVSFIVHGGLEAARKVTDRAKLAKIAPSLGGVETLIEPPTLMSFFELTPEERAKLGIDEGLVRYAVGIEETRDLIADLDQALS
ncbi:MAG: aminotransferase class I/II-fold pyridoxal phosphate-dependent enzyme [Polyangiaceae bacterium]